MARRSFAAVDEYVELEMTRTFFGLRCAPAAFSLASGEITSVLQRRAAAYAPPGEIYFYVYMDDIFLVASRKEYADRGYADIFAYLASIGAEGNAKAVPPCQELPVLGLVASFLDPRGVTLSLPAEKRFSCAQIVAIALRAAEGGLALPHAFLAKLTGKLGHASEVITGGQLRLVALRDAQRDADERTVALAADAAADLRWWLGQLCGAAGPQVLRYTRRIASAKEMVNVASDASGREGAAIIIGGVTAFWYRWDHESTLPHHSMQAKELYPLTLALEEFGHLFRGLTVAYRSDNAANCYALNSGSLGDAEARPLLLRALRAADAHGFRLRAAWNPGENNGQMDGVSRAADAAAALAFLPGFVIASSWGCSDGAGA